MSIAENITRLRKEIMVEKPMSQTDLAIKSGLSPSLISYYEDGRHEPRAGNLVKLATALEVTADELLKGK